MRDIHQNCPFSVAVVRLELQELRQISRTSLLPVATASGDSSCLSGLDSSEQLPEMAW